MKGFKRIILKSLRWFLLSRLLYVSVVLMYADFVTVISFSAGRDRCRPTGRFITVFTNIIQKSSLNTKSQAPALSAIDKVVYIRNYMYWNFKNVHLFVLNFLEYVKNMCIVLQKPCQSIYSRDPPTFTKCRKTTLFLVENTLLLVIQHIKF